MSDSIFTKRLQTILVVGGILLALVILFSVVMPSSGILVNTHSGQAENTAYNLKNAISAYNTEYREFPVKNPDKTKDTIAQTDHALMDVLLAADNQAVPGGLNPRRISFYAGRRANTAKAGKNGRYRKGVKLEAGGASELWDPYSNYYKVLVDTNYYNIIDSPETPGVPIKSTVIVWSAGPDGDFDTWKDNVKTW